jgi:hypothetical protein
MPTQAATIILAISPAAFIELQTLAFTLAAESGGEVSPNDALLVAVRAYRALTGTTSLFETNSKD